MILDWIVCAGLLAGPGDESPLVITISRLSPGTFHPEKTAVWHFHRDSPILRPEGELEMQAGEGNIYAPDVHRKGSSWGMLYGGQGRDGHDRIFLAESKDGIGWKRANGGKPVIDVAREGKGVNHANDPGAVVREDRLEIFYTRAPSGENDLIDRFANGCVDPTSEVSWRVSATGQED